MQGFHENPAPFTLLVISLLSICLETGTDCLLFEVNEMIGKNKWKERRVFIFVGKEEAVPCSLSQK